MSQLNNFNYAIMKLAIDLGGTNIRIAQVENQTILNKKSIPCLSAGTEEEVLSQIYKLIDNMLDSKVTGIGIGVPSVVDHQKGIVYNVANIPSWKEVHLKHILQSKYQLPVSVNNDANCFALGEKLYGQGKLFSNLIGITLGTGVGAGIIINNSLYCGENTGAGEIGSLSYLNKDFEYYCSSNFFTDFHSTTGKEAYDKALAGDATAIDIWNEFGGHLGNLVKAILFTYDPTAVIFGGSISSAFPFFIQSLKKNILDFPYEKTLKSVHLLCTENPDISILGAAAL